MISLRATVLLALVVARSVAFQPTSSHLASSCCRSASLIGFSQQQQPAAALRPTSTYATLKYSNSKKKQSLLFSAAAVDAEVPKEEPGESGGTATIPSHIFNLVKGIVGAGVLTLPAGIATFGNAPSAVIPAVFLITLIGSLSGYGFALIGRVCALTNTGSYRGAWEKSVNEKSSGYVATAVTLKTIFAILAYSMILGDTFQSLALSAGLQVTKTVTLTAVTAFLLLPLCLLKNLSSLAPFSLLGTLGMVYTAIAMGIRCFGKAYAAGGQFATDLPATLRPAFGSTGAAGVLSPSTAILLGMLSTSYMAHFNAPKFYTELKNNTVPRFLKVVSTSFGISIGLFCIMASLGFLTFGGNCSGLILNKYVLNNLQNGLTSNIILTCSSTCYFFILQPHFCKPRSYSTRDSLMGLSRIAVAVSLVFSYPLAFVGARDGVLELFSVKNRSNSLLNSLTVGMLTAITIAALIIPDVSFVLAFAGYVECSIFDLGAIYIMDLETLH